MWKKLKVSCNQLQNEVHIDTNYIHLRHAKMILFLSKPVTAKNKQRVDPLFFFVGLSSRFSPRRQKIPLVRGCTWGLHSDGPFSRWIQRRVQHFQG